MAALWLPSIPITGGEPTVSDPTFQFLRENLKDSAKSGMQSPAHSEESGFTTVRGPHVWVWVRRRHDFTDGGAGCELGETLGGLYYTVKQFNGL